MVWGVCRNQLGEADAEDAFQATFLALMRAGTSIRTPAAVGGWLHRVAVQVCRRASRTVARRRTREGRAASPEMARPEPDAAWHDLHAATHEEIDRLPHRLRTVFVLCGLEGMRPTDVADRLGLKVGTVTGLLSRARQRLLARLKDRQVLGLTGGGAALAVSGYAAAVPTVLLDRTASLTRPDVAAGASSVVHALARHVAEVPMTRWKLLVAVALLGVSFTTGVGGILVTSAAQDPVKPPQKINGKPANAAETTAVPDAGSVLTGRLSINGLASSSNNAESHRPAWEYKVVRLQPDFEAELNVLGKTGWEMVAIDRISAGVASAYLKRIVTTTATSSSSSSGTSQTTASSGTISGTTAGDPFSPQSAAGTRTEMSADGQSSASKAEVVVRLQRLSAGTAFALAKELYGARDGYEGATVDERTNSLIVKGKLAVVKEVSAMLEKLDAAKEPSAPAK
jgi:RNA polymerase sigma factor (sigma-70 family)